MPGTSNLAKGGTARVFRVIPRDGPSYVQKEYQLNLNRDHDLDAFAILSGSPRSVEIDLLDPVALGERTTQMRDVKGKTLEKVMEENEISELEKKHLLKTWNDYVTRTFHHFESQATDVELRRHGEALSLSCTIMYLGKEIQIFLKGDNVIVEAKTGRLVVVDPY